MDVCPARKFNATLDRSLAPRKSSESASLRNGENSSQLGADGTIHYPKDYLTTDRGKEKATQKWRYWNNIGEGRETCLDDAML